MFSIFFHFWYTKEKKEHLQLLVYYYSSVNRVRKQMLLHCFITEIVAILNHTNIKGKH